MRDIELLRRGLLCLGWRSLIKEGKRIKIYLPTALNPLLEELVGKKVKIYLLISEVRSEDAKGSD